MDIKNGNLNACPKKIIGIFGGSFDPVHLDHVNVCRLFYQKAKLSELLVIPTFVSPFKSEAYVSAEARLDMLRLAFSDFCGNVTISDEEISRGGKSYTFETIANIASRYKNQNAELCFLIGEDSALTFHTWKNPREILAFARIAIAGRGGGKLERTAAFFEKHNAPLNKKPLLIESNGFASSTLAREYVRLGVNAEELLGTKVGEYIQKNGLYRGDDKYYRFVKEHVTAARLKHTAGVIYLAREYAKRLGVSEQKAALAALLHDCAKYLDYNDYAGFDLAAIAARYGEKTVPAPVIHQFLGAYIAKNVLGITDDEVLSAIERHTTGAPDMTTLEKIIFTADLLEPSRDYGEVDELRAAVDENFEQGFKLCVERIHKYLKKGDEPLFITDKTYEYYVKNKQ